MPITLGDINTGLNGRVGTQIVDPQLNPAPPAPGQAQIRDGSITQPTIIPYVNGLTTDSLRDRLNVIDEIEALTGQPTDPEWLAFFNNIKTQISDRLDSFISVMDSLLSEFKKIENNFNRLKAPEYVAQISQIIEDSNIDELIHSQVGASFDPIATQSFKNNYIAELDKIQADILAIFPTTGTHGFSLWADDIQHVVETVLGDLFAPDQNGLFFGYPLSQDEINRLSIVGIVKDELIEGIVQMVNIEAGSATPSWNDVDAMGEATLRDDQIQRIITGVVTSVVSQFETKIRAIHSGVIRPTGGTSLVVLEAEDYHSLHYGFTRFMDTTLTEDKRLDAVSEIIRVLKLSFSNSNGQITNLEAILNNYVRSADANNPITQIWDPRLFNIELTLDALPPRTGNEKTTDVEMHFIITPKDNPATPNFDESTLQGWNSDSITPGNVDITIRVDRMTEIEKAMDELKAFIQDGFIAVDGTDPTFQPVDNGNGGFDPISLIERVTGANGDIEEFPWTEHFMGFVQSHDLTQQFTAWYAKYNGHINAIWELRNVEVPNPNDPQNPNHKWVIHVELRDKNIAHHTPDPSLEAQWDVFVKNDNDIIKEEIKKNEANLNLKIYQSEFMEVDPASGAYVVTQDQDVIDELMRNVVSQEFIDAIDGIQVAQNAHWKVEENMRFVFEIDQNGYVSAKLEIVLPDGEKFYVDLFVHDQFSPSEQAAGVVKGFGAPDGIPMPDGTFRTFAVGDEVTLEDLLILYPDFQQFIDKAGLNPYDLRFEIDGPVWLKQEPPREIRTISGMKTITPQPEEMITIIFTDNTRFTEPVEIDLKVNADIMSQKDIDDRKLEFLEIYQGLMISVDMWDGDQAIKDEAQNLLTQLKDEFMAKMDTLVNMPQAQVDKAFGAAVAAMQKVLSDREIPNIEQPNIPRNMSFISKMILLSASSLAAIGGLASMGNALTIATTNRKLKNNDSTIRVRSKKTGFLSLTIGVLLIGISVGMFVYLFINQGGL